MKRIFSIMLMAAALLVGTQVNAADVCKIGSTGYATFEAGFAALGNGQTLELLSDVTLQNRVSKYATVGSTDSMTVDLKGFTITCGANMTAVDKSHDYDGVFDIYHVRILFKNGTIDDNANTTGTTINSLCGAHVTTDNMHILFKSNGENYGSLVADCGETTDPGAKLYVNNCVMDITNGCGVQICTKSEGSFMNSQFTQTTVGTVKSKQQNCLAASGGGKVMVYSGRFVSDTHCLRVYNSGGSIFILGPAVLKGTLSTLSLDNSKNSVDWQGIANYTDGAYAYISSGEWNGDIFRLNISLDGIANGGVEVTGGRFFQQPSTIENVHIVAGYYEKDNNDGSWTVVKNGDEKTNFDAVDENSVVVPNEDTNVGGEKEVLQVNVAGVDLVVKEDAVLTVGKGGIIVGKNGSDTYGTVTVEAGGQLIVDGLIYNDKEVNFIVNTEDGNPGIVLISPDVRLYGEQHPKGTFKFVSNAKYDGGKYTWQRFGIPTADGAVNVTWTKKDGSASSAQTAIYAYDYTADDWAFLDANYSGSLSFSTPFIPFQCYDMTINANEPQSIYSFTGSFMGNQDAELNLVYGWNYLANSYLAPIDLESFLTNIKNQYSDVQATAYIYRFSDGKWDNVSVGDFEGVFGGSAAQTKIDPMQSFILRLTKGTAYTSKIDYAEDVYNPIVNAITTAPARKAIKNIAQSATVTVSNGEESSVVRMAADAQFTNAFDNGYDSYAYMQDNNINLYAVTEDGELADVATDNLDNTELYFNTNKAGVYTMTLSHVNGDFIIRDLANNSTVAMKNGVTYNFAANANETTPRFRIENASKVVTGTDEVMESSRKSGIYTISGLYLGEEANFDVLPAGLYIVNGVKVVK